MDTIFNMAFIKQSGLTFFDTLLIFIFLFYCAEGVAIGFISALFDFFSFVISFFTGLKFYAVVGKLLFNPFDFSQGFVYALSFFITAFITEIFLSVVFRKIIHLFRDTVFAQAQDEYGEFNDTWSYWKSINHVLGFIPALCSAFVLMSFLLTLVVSFPLSSVIKKEISSSKIGGFMLTQTQRFEKDINDVFGLAIHDTINFLTIEPQSNQTIQLNFQAKNVIVDEAAEQQMFQLLNKERIARGVSPLQFDTALSLVGRNYAKDMLERGYFSHYSKEGISPFDRMIMADIRFSAAGENLALAPNTDLAMQGLINSKGHRENILSPNFRKVGIGVMDGGAYGKMFTQEFTD